MKNAVKPALDWFTVSFDEQTIYMRAAAPGKEPWSRELRWDSIIRVCFKAEHLLDSDGIYIFTNQRPESFVIPTEANGGLELWYEIIHRKMFDAGLAIEAAMSFERVFCWPPPGLPPAPPGFINYQPPPPIDPAQRDRGRAIITATLILMILAIAFALGQSIHHWRFSMFDFVQPLISIPLMIALWRGSSIARWLTFTFSTLAGAALCIYSLKTPGLNLILTASTLLLIPIFLAFPSVTTFQRDQRQSRPKRHQLRK